MSLVTRALYRLRGDALWFDRLNRIAAAQRALTGRQMSWRLRQIESVDSLAEVEFSVFSQWGDDGIIQWLVQRLPGLDQTFVEFGVEDYQEANTRFLLVNNNWRGLVMDSSNRNVEAITRDPISWRHDLQTVCSFVTAENIDRLLLEHRFEGNIGLLHIDIDGNDYWVWKSLTVTRPAIAIIEYNSVFGVDRAITVPYDPAFNRTAAHFSNLYFGASLPALCNLAQSKGYDFVGSNSAGNNAYFVSSDLGHGLRPLTAEQGYVASRFLESRDSKGRLSHVRGEARLASIRGLPVTNTITGEQEEL